jgi:MFS family permease
MPRSLKVIISRFGIAQFVFNLNPYSSIYIVALGATGTELGALNSVSLGVSCISAFSTGWISDRRDKKRMFLMGASLGALVPLIYTLSPFWIWLIPAFILAGLAEGLIQPAWNTIYANSVQDKDRGKVYGLVNVFSVAPSLFAGLVGGTFVSIFGGLTIQGIRPVYILSAALLISILIIVWKYLPQDIGHSTDQPLSLKLMIEDYKEVLRIKGARNWALMKSLGSISIGMAGPFWMLYAATVHNTSAITIAYMVTARGLTNILMSPFSGRFCDTIGRKKTIIGGRIIMYVATIIFILSPLDSLLIFAWILMGANDSTGVAWQAEEVELVHIKQRARMTALSVGSFNILAVPASLLGGFLWDNVSRFSPFLIMIVVDGLIRMPFIYLFIPEGSKHQADSISSKQ